MKPVIQQEISGCGFASVAALAGIGYRDVKRVANAMGIHAGDRRLWSETGHVRTLLEHFGIDSAPGETPFGSWEALPEAALLSIKWHREGGRPFWHWVVFWRGPEGSVVLDPKKSLKTHVRTDFGRMHPKWYIPVRPVARDTGGIPG